MKIDTKFEIGQNVFPIVKKNKREDYICPACSGKGVVKLEDGLFYDCPKCEAVGRLRNPVPSKWYPLADFLEEEIFIRKMYFEVISTKEDCVKVSKLVYHINIASQYNRLEFYDNKNLIYATLEEAQFECDERNKENESTELV